MNKNTIGFSVAALALCLPVAWANAGGGTSSCGNGICEWPPEDCVTCREDCQEGPVEVPGMTCQDGADNDCDLLIDCYDPDCATDPFCITIQPGFDYFTTLPGAQVEFGSTNGLPPIPAGFFCADPSGPSWEGTINLEGVPIEPEMYGNASTIIRRDDPVPPPYGTDTTIPIEMVELSLKSVGPITVSCPDGTGGWVDSFFDVYVEIDLGARSLGTMDVVTTSGGGGMYSNASIYINTAIYFAPEGGPHPTEPWLPGKAVLMEAIGPYGFQTEPSGDGPFPGEGPNFFPTDPMEDVTLWWPWGGGGPDGLHPVKRAQVVWGCCLPAAAPCQCEDLSPKDCAARGGVGQATLCAHKFRACCMGGNAEGECYMIDPVCCDDCGGVGQGPGSQCATPAGATEACCLNDDSCKDADQICCDDITTGGGGGQAQGPGSACRGDIRPPQGDDACDGSGSVQACCLPDGTCVDTSHRACVVNQLGDPQGPGTNCLTTICRTQKWTQPPTFNAASPEPNCFWGWDEVSTYSGAQIIADDWMCDNDMPVTDIHWWGSYVGWRNQEAPEAAPIEFHIAIWTDVPAGADADPLVTWSHPGVTVQEWRVSRDVLEERVVGCDFVEFADAVVDTCFRYDFVIPPGLEFTQETDCAIYWVSIAAVYQDLSIEIPNIWGWKTREHFFNDDAVRITDPTSPVGPPIGSSTYVAGSPIEWPEGVSWDMAFVLTSCADTETDCTDGVDNDCDGYTDCRDTDCGEADCCEDGVDNENDGCTDGADSDCGGTETDCTDGADNDCDGLVDCDDPDCPLVAAESECQNGADDDCDGCIDGADSDCGGTETECADSLDNDCDGLIDQDDPDCAEETEACCLWNGQCVDVTFDECCAMNGVPQGAGTDCTIVDCPAPEPITVGMNIDVHQDNPDFVANDFHIEGMIESEAFPVLGDHIDDMFLGFIYSITEDPPGNGLWYKFVADWSGFDYPYCTILHLGLKFEVVCHNVMIDLVGWWTRDGVRIGSSQPMNVAGVPSQPGYWPVLGFDVTDNHSPDPAYVPDPLGQHIRIQSGDADGEPEPGEFYVEILQMDLVAMEGPCPELAELSGGGIYGPDGPVEWASVLHEPGGEPISSGNRKWVPPDSFFDVYFELPQQGQPTTDSPLFIPPGGCLVARQLVWFLGNGADPDPPARGLPPNQELRWFWEMHEGHQMPQPEACCDQDGACDVIMASDCVCNGGTPQGPGTNCDPNLCPGQATEACCFDDGSCQEITVQACQDAVGMPMGTGTNCDPNVCPQPPTEACCFGDGSCQEITVQACQDASGMPLGSGSNCSPNLCPQPATDACCLSNGLCVGADHDRCVELGGDPQGPDTDCGSLVCSALKWSQPPTHGPTAGTPGAEPCFWGWDEFSVYGDMQVVADDWLCQGPDPVTDIHWWGSYIGWLEGATSPPDLPDYFHIAIWTDVALGTDASSALFSHPGRVLREWLVPIDETNEHPVGCDVYPGAPSDTCFRYDYNFPKEDWFFQDPEVNDVYWISIAAAYPDPMPALEHPWGWKTREHFFNDDAVRVFTPLRPSVPVNNEYLSGEPIETADGLSWDMAFVLTTRAPGSSKWDQWPNPTLSGLHAHDTIVLADQWECQGGEVQTIEWWGSYEQRGAGIEAFELSIHLNLPGDPWCLPQDPGGIWGVTVPFAEVNETPTGLINNTGSEIYHYQYEMSPGWPQESGQIYWLNIRSLSVGSGMTEAWWLWQESARSPVPRICPAVERLTASTDWNSIEWAALDPTRYSDMAFRVTSGPPAPPPTPDPSGVKKNRYISMVIPQYPDPALAQPTALRVKMKSLHPGCDAGAATPGLYCRTDVDCPDGDGGYGVCRPSLFPDREGEYRYVALMQDGGGLPIFDCPDSVTDHTTFKCAKLSCEPEYRDWANELNGEVLHVSGPGVVPSSQYDVAVLPQTCMGVEETCSDASVELPVFTARWGNVDDDPQLDVLDVAALVDKVKETAGAFAKPRTQLQPNDPDSLANVNVLDIANCVDTLKAKSFSREYNPAAYLGPCVCPPAVVCGAIPCANNDPCGDGLCVDGSCVDPCGRCTDPLRAQVKQPRHSSR